MLRDYRPERGGRGVKQSAALLTGSANFTKTDCHTNLNHVFVFHDRRICGEYCREFDEISRGEFGRRWHGEVPRAYNVEGVPVRVLFAPDHTPELELIKQILKAERQIEFAIFTFAGSSGIDDALLMAAAADRKVTGAPDPGQAAQYTAPANEFNDENLFVIGSPYAGLPPREGGPVDKQACTKIADYMRREIDRILSVSERWRP